MIKQNFEERNKVFIISAGRTGTHYFASELSRIIPDCFSVHEPDNIQWDGRRHPIIHTVKHCRTYGGFRNLVFLKALGLTGARNHSINRLGGTIEKRDLLVRFCGERKWTENLECSLYVESNQQLFGISEDLLDLPNSRVAYFVRNPVDWIRSYMNLHAGNRSIGLYGEGDWLSRINKLGFRRLTPGSVGLVDNNWQRRSRAEKLAWYWNYVHTIFLKVLEKGREEVRIYKYEDFFKQKDERTQRDFLAFITGCEVSRLSEILKRLEESLEIKIDISDGGSGWDFSEGEEAFVMEICGDLMNRLGYK